MTMPAVFQQLPFGQGLAVVFFSLLVVAALSSSISCWSTCSASCARAWAGPPHGVQPGHCPGDGGWHPGEPVVRSLGHLTLFCKNIFELLDFITSNLMMPLFGLALTLLLGWRLGRQALPEGWLPTGGHADGLLALAGSPAHWWHSGARPGVRVGHLCHSPAGLAGEWELQD